MIAFGLVNQANRRPRNGDSDADQSGRNFTRNREVIKKRSRRGTLS